MRALVLAPLTVADLDEVAVIENVSFTAPWPTSAYTTELTTNRLARYVGARINGTLVGFGGIWLMVDEAHVTTMAVLPANRRTGVATALLLELLQEARRGGRAWQRWMCAFPIVTLSDSIEHSALLKWADAFATTTIMAKMRWS